MKRYMKLTGQPLTLSEQNFINAYPIHAQRLDESLDVDVSDEERKEERWLEVFKDYAAQCPAAAGKSAQG